jgi:hypothetical protein
MVWRGGETTTLHIPVPVGSLKDLAGAPEMERLVLERSAQGISDEAIARELTEQGSRSPMHPFVLPSTVPLLRLKHGQFRVRSQSHPRHVAGSLTLAQLALPKPLTLLRIGFLIGSTMERFPFPKTHPPIFTCSLMSQRPLRGSDSCSKERSRSSIFQGGIKMHDRNTLSGRHPRHTWPCD